MRRQLYINGREDLWDEYCRLRKEVTELVRGGSDGLVGELLKYGGSGMVYLLEQLFSVIWREETVPKQWREGLIVNLFKKGDREDPGNYRGITLLSVVGKVFVKYLTIDWYKEEHCMKGRLALELIEVAWIMFTL